MKLARSTSQFSLLAPILLMVLTVSNFSCAQIDEARIDKKLLEHKIKVLVDSTRIANNLPPLFSDSILYVASNHHVKYLVKKGELSHFEKGITKYYSPQDRAYAYNAPKSYLVGENVVYANYNTVVKVKGKTFETVNYTEIARCLVYSWIRSRGHFKNMINPDYQVTGLSIGVDSVNNRIYSCQKFAQVIYKYDFKESDTFFPYSKLDQDSVNRMLANFPKDLSYPFGLRSNDNEKCEECKETWSNYPVMSVRLKRNYFILRVEDASFVKELIKNRRDGFAVELVPFDAFANGNPAYYDEPSRRNEMKRTSGRVLEPVYRNDLIKGFKKRKRKKNLSFVNYLFSADSVSFFKRFGRYNLVNFDAQYFEIKLGKVPKDMGAWWNHNLMYIHDKQICHFVYLTNYPGEIDLEMIDTPYYPPVPTNDYEFKIEQFTDTLELFYEVGETVTQDAQLKRIVSMYQEKNLRIKSVDIHGTCSVEGNQKTNERLHQERAATILKTLNVIITTDSISTVSSEVAWDHFYENVKDHPKWSFLSEMSRDDVQNYFSDPSNARPLDILREERKVEVAISGVRDLTPLTANYYIKRDLRNMFYKQKNGEIRCVDPDSLQRLYEKAYYFSTVDTISVPDFFKIEIPKHRDPLTHTLEHDIAFYTYHYLKDSVDKTELAKLKSEIESVFRMCGAAEHLSPEFHYLSARFLIDNIRKKGAKNADDNSSIQKAFDRLNLLLGWYDDLDSTFILDVAKANLNIINVLVETIDRDQVFEYNSTINTSLIQIVEYYRSTDKLNPTSVLSLSKLLCYFQNVPLAVELCKEYLYDNEVLKLYLPLAYRHSSYLSSDREIMAESQFLNLLMEAKDRLSEAEWCKLFYGQYGIPFQVMDYEPLHKAFCESCPNRVDEVFNESAVELNK